jgi:hypothetical protein
MNGRQRLQPSSVVDQRCGVHEWRPPINALQCFSLSRGEGAGVGPG